jgi:integrase
MIAFQAKNADLLDRFTSALTTMPALPRIIHYEDDYDEKIRSILVDDCNESITLHISGSKGILKLKRFEVRVRPLIRVYLLSLLLDKAPRTVSYYFNLLVGVSVADIENIALSKPNNFKEKWSELSANYSSEALLAIKSLLSFLCKVRFEHWTPLHADFVSRALPVKQRDNYASVRSGDAFISIEEEALLVRWLDKAANNVKNLEKAAVEMACILICSYQFGMRPKQLGMIRKRECSVRISNEDNSSIVYLTFKMIKQLDKTLSGLTLNRKVKHEWAPLFASLMNHKKSDGNDSFLFGFSSRASLSKALIDKLAEILPNIKGRVAYDLRHSMAQRLVDSGASHEELAAAMGHTRLESSLVYFRATANQAELVNKALGISDTYKAVAKIAANKFITLEDLAKLKGENQIAGAPHGIPIAGIGGCRTGQPACPYNPVTACYGCPKFMPVSDLALHEIVLDEFRSIVHFYKNASRGEEHSPAYLQLQRTISEVQSVIRELKGVHE